MKYLKKFETLKTFSTYSELSPTIGDYVICDEDFPSFQEIEDFVKNNIGQCIDFKLDREKAPMETYYVIKYENIPDKLKIVFHETNNIPEGCRRVERHEIKYWSNNKEDLIPLLSANKYNL